MASRYDMDPHDADVIVEKFLESYEFVEAVERGRINVASDIKRRRATAAEMEQRAQFLIAYAREHGPVTARGLYYQAEVHRLPGIEKDDSGYNKVQRQVLKLRRQGRLDYDWIADSARWMRKPNSYDSIKDALEQTAAFYRRNLWRDADAHVEIWLEKEALAGVIYPVTSKFDVPLMVTRGFSSETFCYEAIQHRNGDQRPFQVYYLGDFDRAGRDAAASLKEKLTRFALDDGMPVMFEHIAVMPRQIESLQLPTRPHKRKSAADQKWPYPYACELDAIPPDHMRQLVQGVIERHLPSDQYRILKEAEKSERTLLEAWAATQGAQHG